MRILLIEDDKIIGSAICEQLESDGHSVDWAMRLDAAGDACAGAHFDLILLDLMLPDGRGIPFLKSLRKSGSKVPVMILTALDQISDRIEGLNAGADDYLVKPFAMEELIVRTQVLSRRRSGQVNKLRIEDVELDFQDKSATRQGKALKVSPTGIKLLECLMRESPNAVSREKLMQSVWGDEQPDSNSLKVHMFNLRKAVDGKSDSKLIQTVSGYGFAFKLNEDA